MASTSLKSYCDNWLWLKYLFEMSVMMIWLKPSNHFKSRGPDHEWKLHISRGTVTHALWYWGGGSSWRFMSNNEVHSLHISKCFSPILMWISLPCCQCPSHNLHFWSESFVQLCLSINYCLPVCVWMVLLNLLTLCHWTSFKWPSCRVTTVFSKSCTGIVHPERRSDCYVEPALEATSVRIPA